MPSSRFPIPQGTLDMLILQIVSLESAHGYGIAQRLEQISRAVVQVNQGSFYPALHRLQRKGGRAARRVETVGDWPGGQVLLPYAPWAPPACRREGQLGAPLRRSHPDLRGG